MRRIVLIDDAHPVGRETLVAITKKSPSIAPIHALRVPNETIAEFERYYDVETLDVPGWAIGRLCGNGR